MNVLILCTGNSARSILGEVLFTALGAGRLRGYSAGSAPKGTPHPLALETLAAHGHPVDGLSSKSWDVFAGPDAPKMDAVITVCDSAASEACPIWPGAPVTAHWGLPDPAAITESSLAPAAFEACYQALKTRIETFLSACPDLDDAIAVQAALRAAHTPV